jgi:Fe2+ or Zn2+ uptake regulation protein
MRRVEKKSRNTQQLQVIWDAIKADKSHPTADQVYDKVRRRLPNVSLGTVYRNLQKLVADEKLQVLMLGRSQHFDRSYAAISILSATSAGASSTCW